MARIIGGIGASHSPTIGFAKDTGKQNDPAWKPIFDGFDVVRDWVKKKVSTTSTHRLMRVEVRARSRQPRDTLACRSI